MVISNRAYSVRSYLDAVTGKYYMYLGDDAIAAIKYILSRDTNYRLRIYQLNEIESVIKDKADVVLVESWEWNENKKEFAYTYIWCEVPENFQEASLRDRKDG